MKGQMIIYDSRSIDESGLINLRAEPEATVPFENMDEVLPGDKVDIPVHAHTIGDSEKIYNSVSVTILKRTLTFGPNEWTLLCSCFFPQLIKSTYKDQ